MMQEAINPHHGKKAEIRHPLSVFRIGDKVMQTKNNYSILWQKTDGEAGMGVFNGDIGFIDDIDRASNTVKVNFDGRFSFYTFDQVNELELAYAITAHKSQGNEFDTVVILLIGRHRKLHYRNLLYTAVTRARRRLVIVGDAKTVEEMVLNAQKSLRYTSLAYLLREEVDIESAGIFN
jgi:exodeoxyribonuclease V alpha subunit